MKTYKIKFKGLKLHAIGKKQTFTEKVLASDFKAAQLKLYDNYDHIRTLTVNGTKYDPLHPEKHN